MPTLFQKTSTSTLLLLALLSIGLISCGSSSAGISPIYNSKDDANIEQHPTPLLIPQVRLMSPPVWGAGERITVIGQNFVAPEEGSTTITMRGNFYQEDGTVREIGISFDTIYRNPGKLEFTFEPGNGLGHEIGTFRGVFMASNIATAETAESAAKDAVIEVGPSLIIWSVSPRSAGCDKPVMQTSLEGEPIVLDLKAIGMEAGTAYAPLTLSVSYADLAGDPQVVARELVQNERTTLEIDPGTLPQGQVNGTVHLNIRASDSAGTIIERNVAVSIVPEYGIDYDGNSNVVELFDPVLVSSCLPGGEFGRDVTYTRGQSESRTRQVGFSASVRISAWVVDASFGMNVSSSVTSGQSESLSMSGHIPAGQYGVFYRQTQRLERTGDIIQYNACGSRFIIGSAVVTDWSWAPDLALTRQRSCPPIPASNLPAAQVLP